MSRESMEVVRRFFAGYDGRRDPSTAGGVDQLGHEPEAAAVLAFWADDPSWRHAHPDIEWSAAGPFSNVRGAAEVGAWWTDWLEMWESYV